MTARTLIRQMEVIAKKLLSHNDFYYCFERHAKPLLREAGKKGPIKTPFYWCITPDNADIIQKHDTKAMYGLFLQLLSAEENGTAGKFVIMDFDGETLLPIFPNKLLEWAKQQEEYKFCL